MNLLFLKTPGPGNEPQKNIGTHEIRKPILMHDFIERTPEKDADQNDLIYRIGPDGIKEFKTGDYRSEMARCTDPAVRARFAAATRRQNPFSDA
jgi:hypothetical protein